MDIHSAHVVNTCREANGARLKSLMALHRPSVVHCGQYQGLHDTTAHEKNADTREISLDGTALFVRIVRFTG